MKNAELNIVLFDENDVIATSLRCTNPDHANKLHYQFMDNSYVYAYPTDSNGKIGNERICRIKTDDKLSIGSWYYEDNDILYLDTYVTQ